MFSQQKYDGMQYPHVGYFRQFTWHSID